MRKALGLDQPLWTQYVHYVTHVIRGDFGTSFQTNLSVADQIKQRYPATIELAMGSMFIALLVAFPLGIISAIYRNSWIDNVARFFALIGVSMPSFWFGPLLIIAFAINHEWFPVSGRDEGSKSLVLPSLTMGLALSAILTRMIRISLADELTQLYVTTAVAKGVTRAKGDLSPRAEKRADPGDHRPRAAVRIAPHRRHHHRADFLLAGPRPPAADSISTRDYPQVQASILVIALTYILVNFASDLLYGVVDPRIKLE